MLLLSGFIMVLLNPQILIHDISFQLSFLSTLGLLILLPFIEGYFQKLPKVIGESLAVTLAATVFTTPIVLYNFERFSKLNTKLEMVKSSFFGGRRGETLKWRLHPLIHTRLDFNLSQNAVGGQANAV